MSGRERLERSRTEREQEESRQALKQTEDDRDNDTYVPQRARRDEVDLTIVHDDLKPGPREFDPLPGDPTWQTVEPNSGIRLKQVLARLARCISELTSSTNLWLAAF